MSHYCEVQLSGKQRCHHCHHHPDILKQSKFRIHIIRSSSMTVQFSVGLYPITCLSVCEFMKTGCMECMLFESESLLSVALATLILLNSGLKLPYQEEQRLVLMEHRISLWLLLDTE